MNHKPFSEMTDEELSNLTPELYEELNNEIIQMQIFEKCGDYIKLGKDNLCIYYGDDTIGIEHDGYMHGVINWEFVKVDKLLKDRKITSMIIWCGDVEKEIITDNFEQRIKEYMISIGKNYSDIL
jgi:hypothetical protein